MDATWERSILRIALCEDNPVDRELLAALLEMGDIHFSLDVFESGEAFLGEFEEDRFDLVFLDVCMKGLTGVQTAELIRKKDSQVVIIFTTSSEDYTREGYRLNAYKYLLKPLEPEQVFDALELAAIKRSRAQGATLAIVANNEPVAIPHSDIIFIESGNRKTLINTTYETYATSMTIEDLLKLLPSATFLASHRSYVVNLDHVDELREDFIMDNGEIAYIAVKNHKKIKRAYENYLVNKGRNRRDGNDRRSGVDRRAGSASGADGSSAGGAVADDANRRVGSAGDNVADSAGDAGAVVADDRAGGAVGGSAGADDRRGGSERRESCDRREYCR